MAPDVTNQLLQPAAFWAKFNYALSAGWKNMFVFVECCSKISTTWKHILDKFILAGNLCEIPLPVFHGTNVPWKKKPYPSHRDIPCSQKSDQCFFPEKG